MRISWKLVLLLGVGLFANASAFADTVADCNATFTACNIPENVLLVLPFLGISGDVILLEPGSTAVSDVFRIFNNLANTGEGTGLGDLAFLYSIDDSTPLPDPSTYSINAVVIQEAVNGPTPYSGNGTLYELGVPEPSYLGLLTLAIPAVLLARKKRLRASMRRLAGCAALALLGSRAGSAQDDIPVVEQLPAEAGMYGRMAGLGPVQSNALAPASTGLTFFTASFNSLGTSLRLPFNIVGTNPANGPAVTTIPTVIVPINVVYQTAGGIALDGTNVAAAVQNSPIFLASDYSAGGTDLGVTQFGDALQRAEFWQLPGFSTNYHVLLGTPMVAPAVTILVTSATQGNLYRTNTGTFIGVIRSSYFDAQLNALLANYSANTLPIFLTDNVYEGSNGTISPCCILGYHSSQGPPASTAKTWIYASYAESGTFQNDVVLDVQALSHEVAEWLNDPFVGAFAFGFLNIIPPAILQNGNCIPNFETGDPLEAPPVAFTQVTNGTVYHLQDEVFLPWYLHTTPSFSVNGWYTLQNTFKTFSTLCGPG